MTCFSALTMYDGDVLHLQTTNEQLPALTQARHRERRARRPPPLPPPPPALPLVKDALPPQWCTMLPPNASERPFATKGVGGLPESPLLRRTGSPSGTSGVADVGTTGDAPLAGLLSFPPAAD